MTRPGGLAARWRPAARPPWLVGASAVVLLLAASATARGASPPLLAGVLPWGPQLEQRWPWSGAWIYPVGDSLDLAAPAGDVPGYRVNRGVSARTSHSAGHEGADLANGRAGGHVRAAAHGVVAKVYADSGGDYGQHVVLAHRLDDGRLVYTVYAHLLAKSIRVTRGSTVHAGQILARVGQTGRATTPHLHFEVRVPNDSTARWENCPVVDPVEFVRDRLPSPRSDTTWATSYLVWAELAGIVPRGTPTDDTVGPSLLDRMVERAAPRSAGTPPGPSTGSEGDTARTSWNDVARGISWLHHHSAGLAPGALDPKRHADCCARRFGFKRPSRNLPRLAGLESPPRVGEVCLALADLVVRPPRRKQRLRKRSRD